MARHKSRRNYRPARRAPLPSTWGSDGDGYVRRISSAEMTALRCPPDRALELIRAGFKEVKGWNVKTRPEHPIRVWNFHGWVATVYTPDGGRFPAGGRYINASEAMRGAQELAQRVQAGRYKAEIWA